MEESQKKYVVGFLAAIMLADGEVAESEVKKWDLVSLLAGFPEMTFSEALEYWGNH